MGALQALDAARQHGLPAVIDVDRPVDPDPSTDTGRLLDAATHLLYSRDALLGTTAAPDIASALAVATERSEAWVGVTDGPDGVWWSDDGDVQHLPAFPVDAVDTLGAGDVFHGAFALALAEGRTERAALRFGAAAAAVKCTRAGGRAGIPDRATVDALLVDGNL